MAEGIRLRTAGVSNYRPPTPEAIIPLSLTQQFVLLEGVGQQNVVIQDYGNDYESRKLNLIMLI